MTDPAEIKPLGQFQVSELDSPFSRTPGARFGAHQFCERMSGTIVHRGLVRRRPAHHRRRRSAGAARGRPLHPRAVPAGAAPQSNDVALDDRGLIYIVDRHVGFDVLEFNG